ncbi:MAG: cytidine deaminase [Acidobacteria bacterium]|nr:MAG: cytidine deaminase [Acidobacteriota bacterium]
MDWQPLYDAALEARRRAYAPYSRFRVGAALLLADGTIASGCNVENRSYGLAICAERNAVAHAVARGQRDFRAIAVVTDVSPPAVPCGMCLETLTEFAPDLPILVANLDGERRQLTLRQLHPMPFVWPQDEDPA